MKFENVSLLLSTLRDKLEEFGSTIVQRGQVVEKQKGVVRTNCMDCLDRTNVCQSSFARHVLDMQLKAEGFDMDAQVDQQTTWFNTLWADNGDAVSKQYASTAAMKGDYTRTKKRDYRGALNDLSLSLARFYSGMVNDYFSQTAIDFLLGNVNERVFEEFEADMMTKDPAISVAKLREQAIELCQKRVVADESEEVHGAWALISPHVSDTIKSLPMEEVVLLLTDAALYVCRFDWNMDKVSSFERVDLRNITGIKLGTYITSIVSPSHMDASKNVGFVVAYQPGKADVVRTNTRTSSTRGEIAPIKDPEPGNEKNRPLNLVDFFTYKAQPPAEKKLAFKAPYVNSSTTVSTEHETELQQITTIASEIARLTKESRLYKRGEEHQELIQKEDIISLEEAKKNTGLLEQLGHSIKRLVWA
ncbi:Phosphatidylinositide phosphatase-like protein [Emericellopsis cladophorae]|uniref:Phosphatidylinositide phosphatase-like protein n=1 Tax=Emericellopsis cladophorae TaxID=2686198 RepID=A0A9Q0BDB9_9HYPO|nr:Phosphatidylinositide phosphatase-like protein [Emericellopsis cladophorae]KAI6781712.1 Phosphatidylinositide phosphatase-like protein [Emericellopsis cladophorae]